MMPYVDAYLIPIAPERLDAYREFSRHVALIYREYGALRVVDTLLQPAENNLEFHAEGAREGLGAEDQLPDFRRAAGAQANEAVILSWTEWPSQEARDRGLAQAVADPRIQPEAGQEALFEGRRLVAGSFAPFLET